MDVLLANPRGFCAGVDRAIEIVKRAIETLGNAGLKVVMCTPTATPPKWLIDMYPEILPVDPETGRTRGFGSRRLGPAGVALLTLFTTPVTRHLTPAPEASTDA